MCIQIPIISILISVAAAGPIAEAWKEKQPARVGEPAPAIAVHTASGSMVAPEDLQGKAVLLTFWSTADKPHRRHIDRLATIRQKFTDEPGFLMMSVHVVKGVQSDHDDWMGFLDERGTASYSDLKSVRFDSDPRWWQVFETGGEDVAARVRACYGVTDTPRSFLIGRDGKIVAANVPLGQLRGTVARYFRNRSETSKTAVEGLLAVKPKKIGEGNEAKAAKKKPAKRSLTNEFPSAAR